MPQYGGGAFQRAGAYYTDPTAEREMMRGAGAEKAAYLSAMDQFYAELEEEKRQFGEKMGLERKRFAFEEESQEEQYQLALRGQTEVERAARKGEAWEEERFGKEQEWMREQMKFPYQWAEEQEYFGGGAGGGVGGAGGAGAGVGARNLQEQLRLNVLKARQSDVLGGGYRATQLWRGMGASRPQKPYGTGVAWDDEGVPASKSLSFLQRGNY